MEPTSIRPTSIEDPEYDEKALLQALGSRLGHLIRHNSPSDSKCVDLYGSLLPTGNPSVPMWSTIEEAYPELFVDDAHAEYMRKLEEKQANHLKILASLRPSAPSAPETSKAQTFREQLASGQARKPPVAQPKATDPQRVAAAQALAARQKAAREAKEAAATQFFRQAQPLKAKATTATKFRASTPPKSRKLTPRPVPSAAPRRSTSPQVRKPSRIQPVKPSMALEKTPPAVTREESEPKGLSVPAMRKYYTNILQIFQTSQTIIIDSALLLLFLAY